MPKAENASHHRFWGQTERNRWPWFWGQTKKSTIGFEAKPGEAVATNFEVKLKKTVPLVLRPKHWQTVPVVLRPNHWQTIELGFEAQPRNLRLSSSHARCRSHIVSPDLSIVWPPSTQHVRLFLVLCTRSHTSATILIAVRQAAPATYTPWDKQTWFSTWYKDERKTTEMYWIQIQTSRSQWLITLKPRNSTLPLTLSM
jgi:hypothetical protein